jgi:hypothetical protein
VNHLNFDKQIFLLTNDGVKIKVPMAITNMSKLLFDAFEGKEDDTEEEQLTVSL